MKTINIEPIADIILSVIHEGDAIVHGITEAGRNFVLRLTLGIRTQELSMVLIHISDIDSVMSLIDDCGLRTLTL